MKPARNQVKSMVVLGIVLFCTSSGMAAQPPTIPIGLDAYRQWDRLPSQRIGERSYMRSTYDRAGGNEGADASHFLYQVRDSFNVTLDVIGRGELYFARYNHWHGSPWHYELDGTDHVVTENGATFLPQSVFPNPLTWTWGITQGADLMWVPLPFTRSFRMAYGLTHYGTGYYIYHLFSDTTALSQPLRSFDFVSTPDTAVLNLINRSGADIAPLVGTPLGDSLNITERTGTISLPAHDSLVIVHVSNGPATIRALKFSTARTLAVALGRVFLRVTWDNRSFPSIDAPLNLFFGTGSFYNPSNRQYLVKAFPVSVRFDTAGAAQNIYLSCYFPMPYFQSCTIELVNRDTASFSNVNWSLRSQPLGDAPNQSSYFHASYKDHGSSPANGQDLVFLDTRAVEGGGDWSGSFVGTSFIFSTSADLGTLEGDPRFFFDDSRSPQAYGTGTEEWGGGGDYWGGQNMTIPFAGHPVGAAGFSSTDAELNIESAYRYLIADCMPFGKNARIQFEHGGTDGNADHYSSVTCWYGLPAPSLIQTDSIKIGNTASEQTHAYQSPDASAPYTLTSAFDALGPVVTTSTDSGRTTLGTSTFRVQILPANYGVMLRRTLDYQYPNQKALVSVSTDTTAGWKTAGTWYLAGSNTCMYSNPAGEGDLPQQVVETSSRRFRDDEFLISRQLTNGSQALWVRIQDVHDSTPLYPGYPFPQPSKWSEMEYKAYSYVMPDFSILPSHERAGKNPMQPAGMTLAVRNAAARGMIQIEFRIPDAAAAAGLGDRSPVRLRLYDIKGALAATILTSRPAVGTCHVSWNASAIAPGTYLMRLTEGNWNLAREIAIVR